MTVVEALERILPPYDDALAKPVAARCGGWAWRLHLGCSVQGMNASGDAVRIRNAQGEESLLPADQVLVTVGRRPRTEGWGLESLMLDMNGRAVRIDAQCRTSMRGVWAIGDLVGEPMLAHSAMAQGEMVAEIIAGRRRRFTPAAIPAVCFTDPEMVVVGRTPDEAARDGLDCISALFPFSANGRALTLESSEGFVRVVARRDDHLIVGWQAVGRGVSELSTAFATRSKWARGSKTSRAPSTPTRRWARRCRRRRCARSDTRCTCSACARRPCLRRLGGFARAVA